MHELAPLNLTLTDGSLFSVVGGEGGGGVGGAGAVGDGEDDPQAMAQTATTASIARRIAPVTNGRIANSISLGGDSV